jgi:peroxiredoxin
MWQYPNLKDFSLSELGKEKYTAQDVSHRQTVDISTIGNAIMVFYPGPSLPKHATCSAPAGWGEKDDEKRAPGCTKQSKEYLAQAEMFKAMHFDVYLFSPKSPEVQMTVATVNEWKFPPNIHAMFDSKLVIATRLGINTFTATDSNVYPDPVAFIVQKGKVTDEIYVLARTQESEADRVLKILKQLGHGGQAAPQSVVSQDQVAAIGPAKPSQGPDYMPSASNTPIIL